MLSISIVLTLIGFYIFYVTAQKDRHAFHGKMKKWLIMHVRGARIIGAIALVIPFLLLIRTQGFGVGLFNAILLLMTVATLTIMLAPFKYLNGNHIVIILAVCLLCELFIV